MSLAESPDAVARQVAEEFRFAVEHDGPLFLLVHYDHEQDKIRFLDTLRRLVSEGGLGTQTLDPTHHPEHGAGFLYPILSAADGQTLSLVTSLPRECASSRPDPEFLGYINLHRDDIGRRRLRWVLCLHTSEVELFLDSAGDLWDVRQRTYWLERAAGDTPGKAFLEASRSVERGSPATLEAGNHEIEREVERVRARVETLASNDHKVGAMLDLAGWLNRRRAFKRAIEAATAGLELVGDGSNIERAGLLHELGSAYLETGHAPEALTRLETSLKISREVRDRTGEGTTLNDIGQIYESLGRLDEALAHYEGSLEIRREVGDRAGEGKTLNNIGQIYRLWGKLNEALTRYEASLKISREVGDRDTEGSALNNIALVYRSLGKLDEALAHYEGSLEIRREVGDRTGEGTELNNIARIYQVQGVMDKALAHYEGSLKISLEVENRAGEGTTLNNIAGIYRSWGKLDEALAHYEASLKISREVGDRAGELVTRWNIGCVLEQTGAIDRAVDEIRASVALEEELRHPDLEKDRAHLADLEAQALSAAEVAKATAPYRADAD